MLSIGSKITAKKALLLLIFFGVEEFGLEIPDDEAENITTIQSAADWIEDNS